MKTKNEFETSTESLKQKKFSQGLPEYNPYAAGIDIGDSINDVAISDGKNGYEVR